MTINIIHQGMELTPAIKGYVEEKMSSLEKYADTIQHMDVEVGMTTHHHQKGDIFMCKAVVQVEGEVLRLEREADDLYKAIDEAKDVLRVRLTDLKERREDRSKGKE